MMRYSKMNKFFNQFKPIRGSIEEKIFPDFNTLLTKSKTKILSDTIGKNYGKKWHTKNLSLREQEYIMGNYLGKKVSNVKFNKGKINFKYDGHNIINKAKSVPYRKDIASWAHTNDKNDLYYSKQLKPQRVPGVLVHEAVEQYVAKKKNLSYNKAHEVALSAEEKYVKNILGQNWQGYQNSVLNTKDDNSKNMAFDINAKTGYPIADYPESFDKKAVRKYMDTGEVIDLMSKKGNRDKFIEQQYKNPGDETRSQKRKYPMDKLEQDIVSDTVKVSPIILEFNKEGELGFFEGRHRAAKQYELGLKGGFSSEIPAVIITPKDTSKDSVPIGQAKYVTIYHGTRKKFLPSIMKEGLQGYTYFSPQMGVALVFAKKNPKVVEDIKSTKQAVVLKATIPVNSEIRNQIEAHKEGKHIYSVRVPTYIPPEYLSIVDLQKAKRTAAKEEAKRAPHSSELNIQEYFEGIGANDTSKNRIPIEKAKYITAYHGTQQRFVPIIKEQGLPAGMFVTPNEATALLHAESGPEKEIGGFIYHIGGRRYIPNPQPVIIKARVPLTEHMRESLKHDEQVSGNIKNAYQLHLDEPISPENLEVADINKVKKRVIHQLYNPLSESFTYTPRFRRTIGHGTIVPLDVDPLPESNIEEGMRYIFSDNDSNNYDTNEPYKIHLSKYPVPLEALGYLVKKYGVY